MYNEFFFLNGKPATKDLLGKWDPNPYHSGPSTHTINSISERHALKPSHGVKYFEDLLACPAQSSCTGLGTVGIIPQGAQRLENLSVVVRAEEYRPQERHRRIAVGEQRVVKTFEAIARAKLLLVVRAQF